MVIRQDNMDPLTISVAAGLRARTESLELLANNLANTSSPGFKADREAYSLYLSEASALSDNDGTGRAQGRTPLIERTWVDLRQGELVRSDSMADLALQGPGFFVLDSPEGPLLARQTKLLVGGDGRLLNEDGFEFQTVEPRRIRAQPGSPLTVQTDGTVLQDDVPLGRLRIAAAPQPENLKKRYGLYFHLDTRLPMSAKAGGAAVRQGYLEQSNVNPAQSAVRLVEILRQFESLQRALQLGGEMNRKCLEEVARVSG